MAEVTHFEVTHLTPPLKRFVMRKVLTTFVCQRSTHRTLVLMRRRWGSSAGSSLFLLLGADFVVDVVLQRGLVGERFEAVVVRTAPFLKNKDYTSFHIHRTNER